MNRSVPLMIALLMLYAGVILAQNAAPTQPQIQVPIYRVVVVGRTIKAINYRHRQQTKVDFCGTSLMPQAVGQADVQSREGTIKIDARLSRMGPASQFGAEYMTYVLWAISPEGRPVNLGEVLPDRSGNMHLAVTSDLQAFGMIVTAEPHFAVTQPSDIVVMENFVTTETNGTVEEVDAKYELLQKGQYTTNVNSADLTPMPVNDKTPIEIYEARNALRIAQWAGAQTYAPDTLEKARTDLQNAESLFASKGNRKDVITDAREAAQTAEDARLISVRKMLADEQERAKEQAAKAQAQAQADAAAAAQAKEQAERAQQERAAADAAQQAAAAQAQQAQLQAQQAQLQAQQARAQAQQAEQERTDLRAKLQQQLNSILATRDTARGLIMNMSDVLFDTGKYTLKTVAREKLAKISGILLAYPGLSIEIDGYTDSTGSDEFNQTLSEERASSVRDYLLSQGVPADSMTSKGFGKTNPIASNDTYQGRQQNRRVELVVSGDSIRSQLSAPAQSASATPQP